MLPLGMTSLSSGSAETMLAILQDLDREVAPVFGTVTEPRRGEIGDMPILLAKVVHGEITRWIFAAGSALAKTAHVFAEGQPIAAIGYHTADAPELIAIDHLCYRAGVPMPRPHLVLPDRSRTELDLDDLSTLRISGDPRLPLDEAKARYYRDLHETVFEAEELFYGGGHTGAEGLPKAVRTVQLGQGPDPLRLHVTHPWTLDILFEVARLGCLLSEQEIADDQGGCDATIAALTVYGLAPATWQSQASLKASFLAAGGDADPESPDSFERFKRSRRWWYETRFAFVPESGTLTLTTMVSLSDPPGA